MMTWVKVFYTCFFLLLQYAGIAQVKHNIGVIGGKVFGTSYRMQYERWSVNVDAGWLTGFKGGYASINGLYGITSSEKGKNKMWVDVGLGTFVQNYTSPTQQQREFAKKMGYTIPIGVQVASKIIVENKMFPRLRFGMHVNVPIILREEDRVEKNYGEYLLSYCQLSVQYKIK